GLHQRVPVLGNVDQHVPDALRGGGQLPVHQAAGTLAAGPHLVVAVVLGQDLRPGGLVVRQRGPNLFDRPVDDPPRGNAYLCHGSILPIALGAASARSPIRHGNPGRLAAPTEAGGPSLVTSRAPRARAG